LPTPNSCTLPVVGELIAYQLDMVNSRSDNLQLSSAVVNDSFDLEAAIADLLCGAGAKSIELPSCLTPDQRKQARLVADQHPELKCESYGFGADRRLHVFKRSATTCVRVKNTFVDGWASDDTNSDKSDPIIFRSVPSNLWERAQLCSVGTALRHSGANFELPPLCTKSCQDRPVHREDSSHSLDEASTPSSLSLEEVTPLSTCVSEHPAFPPGNFDEVIALGTLVAIQGLVRAPAFNGRIGVVQSLDTKTSRYDVMLLSPTGGQQWTKVKFANLRPVPSGTLPAAAA